MMNRTFWTAIILCILCFIGCDKIDSEEIPAMQPGFMVRKVITPETEYLYEYDELNRLSSITFHDGIHRYEFDYSEDGKLTVTGYGHICTYYYGDDNELTSINFKYADIDCGTLYFTHSNGYPIKCVGQDHIYEEYLWENGNMKREIVTGILAEDFSYSKILNNWHVPVPIYYNLTPTHEMRIYPMMNSRNIPDKISNTEFHYERDSNGNISKITKIAGQKSYVYMVEY